MAELTHDQVSANVLKRFSSRRAESVEKAHALVGAGTRIGAKGMARIALDTRDAKRKINDTDWHEMVRPSPPSTASAATRSPNLSA